jgi:hypothetical protein
MNDFEKGTVIKRSYSREPVELKLVENAGNYIHIIGATTISKDHIDQLVPNDGSTKRGEVPLFIFLIK